MTFGSVTTIDLVPSVDSLGPSCGRLGTSGGSLRPSAAGLLALASSLGASSDSLGVYDTITGHPGSFNGLIVRRQTASPSNDESSTPHRRCPRFVSAGTSSLAPEAPSFSVEASILVAGALSLVAGVLLPLA